MTVPDVFRHVGVTVAMIGAAALVIGLVFVLTAAIVSNFGGQ